MPWHNGAMINNDVMTNIDGDSCCGQLTATPPDKSHGTYCLTLDRLHNISNLLIS